MRILGIIPPPSNDEHHSARIWAAGAVALLAVMMVALLILSPPPEEADLMPPALRAERIAAFQRDTASCRAAIAGAGFATERVADVDGAGACGYRNAVELTRSSHLYSGPVATSCGLAAGLTLWERDVVAPAALRYLGQPVTRIELAGPSYACRAVAGRRDHRLSEHAYANAIDIGGFTLADGRLLTVESGWRGPARDRAFLRAVRAGACNYFKAVLSPDYNRAHANHLHFDLGRDKLCR